MLFPLARFHNAYMVAYICSLYNSDGLTIGQNHTVYGDYVYIGDLFCEETNIELISPKDTKIF
jgi:hypothetical protein